ncbi:MAG: 23S rRNA (pseudouridine(1915)-N(3))-methyltransferase RlmH [Myxococcales bacterium]|nr:23S rRNA (pseudouridine(1915)-N(3))-methyltransferase RlmH [Myxococcales bacterium]MCB9545897.1 23S rRNA (pseudouridine(1915)-N(3))-methyltransferase RlmH [Myxococcales bacterium]
MRLQVIAVGRLKLDYARLGCAEYATRLGRHFPLDIQEVRDAHRSKGGDAARFRADEARSLLGAVAPGATLVALDERGREWDSRAFADWLAEQRDAGTGTMAFLIGGPDGLDPEVRERARVVWSLGRLTMPHELARLVLLEQLYRAASILQGSPYHRD